MDDTRRRQSSRPSEGQKATHEEMYARKYEFARKKTHELFQVGGACAHYGFMSPG